MANPTDLDDGDVVSETWVDAVAAQVLRFYPSTGARSSDLPSPFAGQGTVLTTNAATEGLEIYNSAGQWRKPWNLPWGEVTSAQRTVDQVISTSLVDVTGTSVTFDSVDNRRLRVTVSCQIVDTAASANDIGFTLTTSANVLIYSLPGHKLASASAYENFCAVFPVETTTTGSVTWKLRAIAAANGVRLNSDTYPLNLIIEDMGPAGAPA